MRGLSGLKGMGKLKGLTGLGGGSSYIPALEDKQPKLETGQEDPLVMEIWRVMGGKGNQLKVARQAAKLQVKLPYATTPELLVYLWLKEKGIPFEFQAEANGGRRSTGGSVIDFLCRPGPVWAVRVQGSYWHGLTQQQVLDEIRKKLLEGQYVMGFQIDSVVDVWEHRVYQDREETMTLAMAGIQLGQ
jgi:hypothetical protein